MAGKVKGIIVEIGGDTSALQKSLNKVNTATSSLTKELNSVNRLLKVDPKSTEMLAQKQELLNQKIDATSDKLNQLKKIQSEYVSQDKDLNTENYRALTREIEKTSQELNRLKSSSKSTFDEISQHISNIEGKMHQFSSNISSLGNKLTVGISTPLLAAGVSALSYSSDIEQLQTSFEVMTGSADEAVKTINDLKELGANTPYELKGLASTTQLLMQYGFTATDAIDATRMLGDISQGSSDKMDRIATAYGQMSSAGKVQLENIQQMIEAGFNPLQEISKSTGESMDSLYDRVSAGTVSIDEITESIKRATAEGGQFYKSSEKQSETLAGRISTLKDETAGLGLELVKNLLPIAKDIVKKATDLVDKFGDLSDEEKKNVVQVGLLLVALGPTVKIIGTLTSGISKGVKVVGTFTQAINVMKTGIDSTNKAANTLASVMTTLTSPTTLAITTIVGAVTVAIAALVRAQEEIKKTTETIGNASVDYVADISTAKSHLDSFNSTLFASSTEQKELATNMQEIQNGITTICKTASDERRDYTQEEITQLDEYFDKLRQLNQREVEIQQEIAGAITQQAVANAKSFQGSLNEYKVQSQEWINTALEQKNSTLELIEEQTIQELAYWNQFYGDKATMDNDEYAAQYNRIMEEKQKKIDTVNDEVSKVTEAYSNGYAERLLQNDEFKTKLDEFNNALELENERHNNKLIELDNSFNQSKSYQEKARREEAFENSTNISGIYKNLFKSMSESEQEQLGSLIAMAGNTEMYGGQMSDETAEIVNTILDNYARLPKGNRKIMKETMSPMLDEMEKAEPSLFAKASGIAEGILSRLRTAFDIHSPSKETRDIFQNVIRGAIIGFDIQRKNLLKEVDSLTDDVMSKFDNLKVIDKVNMEGLNSAINKKASSLSSIETIKVESDKSLTLNNMKEAFKEALKEIDFSFILNKEKIGKMVTEEVNSRFGEMI